MQDYFSISGIKKSYKTRNGSLDVLGGIDLSAKEKEFICIMGTSGCGKSTLMRIMEGIEVPSEGQVVLEDNVLPKKSSKSFQKKFGIVYQSDNLLEWKTVYNNVKLPLDVFHAKKGFDYKSKIMEVLDLVGLSEFKDCLPNELSGGMKQRAAIARALVTNPDLLMLDQPFGALDAITRKMLNVELLKIWKNTQKTCIMITNNVNEALFLGQRILIMSNSPSQIIKEIEVPFSYEQRNDELQLNEEYLRLRNELNHIVRSLK